MLKLAVIVLVILVLDAIVSALEAALYTVPMHRVHMLAVKRKHGLTLLALKRSMDRPITTLIALSNFITIAGSIFAGAVAAEVFGDAGIGVFAALLTFIIMMFGEIIPKRIGERYATRVALFGAPAVQAVSYVFFPVTRLIEIITKPIMSPRRYVSSEEEIEFLATLAEQEGVIEAGERQLIHRVFRLNDITARDIMTPKEKMTCIDGEKTIGEAAYFISSVNHSRLPVYEGHKNNVIGVVHQRNLLRALVKGETDQPVKNYAWDAMTVSESAIIDDLLRDMREKRAQLAIVVAKDGTVSGVVGIEDILEELVGEIVDEKDVVPDLIKRMSKNEIVVHGQTRVPYINHFFQTAIKSKKTLNGFLLGLVSGMPASGDAIEYGDVVFIIEVVGPKTIDRVRIVKK